MWPEPASTPLPRLEFNKHLDALLTTGKINPEILGFMDSGQQYVLNEVKKSLVRLEKRDLNKS